MIEKTFAIIKPDAVSQRNSGNIINMIEANGFDILGMKKLQMSKAVAEHFYDIHQDKPFFKDMIKFITSGPVIVLALQRENAIQAWRDLIGSTNPEDAAEGTIRKLYGKNIDNNAVHGSDASETAAREISIFFPEL
jgi:nucleoside-diphosphate kinase